jgi:hypothetical protein
MGIRRPSITGLALLGLLAIGACSSSSAWAAAPEKPATKPASEVTGTSATLHGVLNPKVSATTGYHFTYGTTEASCEGNTTEPGAEVVGKAIKVSTPLTGLIPHTKYTFCLVATNAAAEETKGAPLSFETPAVLPLIEEESASAITETSATLSALVNPEFQETTCKGFQFGLNTSYGSEAPCEPEALGSGSVGESTRASLTGLGPNTTYHYRVLAENSSGKSEGEDHTFLTLPTPPTVMTGEASALTPTSATISASVDPGSEGPNSDTTYFFEYGPTASYGAQTPTQDAGQGSKPLIETANLTGLEPGSAYHYRIVATNDNANAPQITYGQDATFTSTLTPPALSAVAVASVTQSSVTITAALDPNGLPTRYELDLGTGGALSAIASANVSEPTPLALSIGSLTPGTVYSFRLSATNLNGGGAPAEGSFTTASASAGSPLGRPPTPPLLAVPSIAFPSASSSVGGVLAAATKKLTNAQKLAKALKACRKKPRRQRAGCERVARRRYGGRR